MVIFNNLINGSSISLVTIKLLSILKEFTVFKGPVSKQAQKQTLSSVANRILRYFIFFLLINQHKESFGANYVKNLICFFGIKLVMLCAHTQYAYAKLRNTKDMVMDEIVQYSDLLNALTFEDIQNCPIAEKFSPRTLKVLNMRFLSFWDKILVHESMSFIPLFNMIIITLLETNKGFLREFYQSLSFMSLSERNLRIDWLALSKIGLKSLLAILIFKACLEIVKWQILRISNNYKLRNLADFPVQKCKLTESNISKMKEK